MPDLKFQQLTAATPIVTDILPFVQDPSGVPLDRKATFQDIIDLAEANVSLQESYDNGATILTTVANPVSITSTSSSDPAFVIPTGSLGIGTITPEFKLNIVGDPGPLGIDRYASTANGPGFIGRHARGTSGVPLALLADDAITTIGGRPYDGTSFTAATTARIDFNAAENQTATDTGSYIDFLTTPNGTVGKVQRMRIDQNGTVGIGTNTPDASSKLDLTSTTQGFLTPRMTTAQRDLIGTPATGLEIYNTTTLTKDIYNGTAWVSQDAATDSLQKSYDGGNNILQSANSPVVIRNNGIAYGNQPAAGSYTDMTGNKIQVRLGDNRTVTGLPMEAVGQTIIDDTSVTFIVGVSYNASTIAFFDNNPSADTITDSANGFVTAGFVVGDTITITGSTSNDGTYLIASVTAGTITLDDTGVLTNEAAGASVTITSADNKIDFGVNLATLSPIPVAVAGVTTHLIGLSILILKDSNVAGDENSYQITGLMDGGATNSVAIVADLTVLTAPTFTSTSGTAKIFNPVDAISGRGDPAGGGPVNVRIFSPGMGSSSSIASAEFIDSTTFQFGHALFNVGSITTALDATINIGPIFGESADVPFHMYSAFGSTEPNAPDHIFLARVADPTSLAPFGAGGLWYNATAGVFKYYDGSTTQTLSISGTATQFDAVVAPSGGDYTTFNAAYTAGARSVIIRGAVVETVGTTLTAANGDVYVYVDRESTWGLGAFRIVYAGSVNLHVEGATLNGSLVNCAPGAGLITFDGSGNSSQYITLQNLQINNTGAGAASQIAGACRVIARNLEITLPNQTGVVGLGSDVAIQGSVFDGILFVGGGASCGTAIRANFGSIANIFFTGTWSATGPMMYVGSGATATNIQCQLNTQARIEISGGQLSGLQDVGGAASPDIKFSAAGSVIKGGSLGTGDIDFDTFTGCHVADCSSDGLLDMSDVNASDNFISNSKFDTNMTIAGTGNQFSNFKADGTVTISGNQNLFTTTRINADFTCSGAFNRFNGLDLPAVAVNTISGASNSFNGWYASSSFNVTQAGNMLNGGECNSASTISGTKCGLVNNNFIANSALALSITGDDCSVSGGYYGQSAGAGVGTITIGVGATRVSVTGAHTDVAIVDNNGGSGLSNNFVF